MSSIIIITRHDTAVATTTKPSPSIASRSKKPKRIPTNPAARILLLSFIFCILGTPHSAAALKAGESIATTTPTSKNLAFFGRRTPLERKNMSTRSGVRYRGGSVDEGDAASAPTPNDADGNSAAPPAPGESTVPTTASVPTTAATATTAVETVVSESSSSEKATTKKPFSWKDARETLFPIEGDEAKKFLLIGSIKFFIIMALTLTRDTKDTLVVTQCGAEAIAFLKVSSRRTKHRWLGLLLKANPVRWWRV